jgi:hypothetical protein
MRHPKIQICDAHHTRLPLSMPTPKGSTGRTRRAPGISILPKTPRGRGRVWLTHLPRAKWLTGHRTILKGDV